MHRILIFPDIRPAGDPAPLKAGYLVRSYTRILDIKKGGYPAGQLPNRTIIRRYFTRYWYFIKHYCLRALLLEGKIILQEPLLIHWVQVTTQKVKENSVH
jgi:hypothetical protein